ASEIYTLSLHDALPIYGLLLGEPGRERAGSHRANIGGTRRHAGLRRRHHAVGYGGAGAASLALYPQPGGRRRGPVSASKPALTRSEEHTSELQSRGHLV